VISPHETPHTLAAGEGWPLRLGVVRGASVYACAACGEEVPDGAQAARAGSGVVVWSGASPLNQTPAVGLSETVILHDCRGGGSDG
jgi:hypothetical protein